MPLLDVVFLLLTFFIYAMAVMVRVEALEVGLAPVAGGNGPGDAVQHVLRIEPAGELTYNDQPLDAAALDALLRELALDQSQPRLFVALTDPNDNDAPAAPSVDRGVVMWQVLQAIEAAGLRNVAIVGRPGS